MQLAEFPSQLITAVQRRSLIPFVGAGCSLNVQKDLFPTWTGLLDRLANSVEKCVGEDAAQLVRLQLKLSGALAAADSVVEHLRPADFGETMRSIFDPERPQSPNLQTQNKILSLNAPVIITTNYDNVLKWAAESSHRPPRVVTNRQHDLLAGLLRTTEDKATKIWHLHGHVDDVSTLILATSQYQQLYDQGREAGHVYGAAYQQLNHVLTNFTLLFLGFGLEDKFAMDAILKNLQRFRSTLPQSYALMKAGSRDIVELQRTYNVHVIEYAEHDHLPSVLQSLIDQAGQNLASAGSSSFAAESLVISAYLDRLAGKTASIEMMGMGRSCQIDLPIAEVYVPLRLVRSTRFTHLMTDRVPGDESDAGDADELSVGAEHADGDPSEQLSLQHVFEHCSNLQKRGLVILGEPGAGKTTWAQQLAWQLASGTVTAEQLGLPIGLRPVFLKLRNLSTAALAAETDAASSLLSFLKQETVASGAPEGLQDPSGELWNDAQNGILWILDGLDEVVSPVARAAVSGWVRELRGQRTADWFVVTSRFQGYQQDDVLLGSQFLEFHVHGLSDDQVDAFVRRWFAAAHQRQLGPGMRVRATEKADKDSDTLLKVLQTAPYQSPSMREMVTNPLLLTILCVVYHEEHNLPTARAELYQHCVRVLLGLWRQELYEGQEEVQPFDSDAAQTVLSCLAWWMHEAKEKTAAVADLVGQAETALRTVQAEAGLGLDGRHFIDRMREESGILAFGGEGQARCGFLHLSFQEFLAAYYAVQSGLAEQLVSRMTDSWWREVALLSLRQSRRFCEEFFAAMLAAELPQQNMDLAQRCLTESSHFVPGPFVDVLRDESSSIAAKGSVLRLLRDRVDQVPELPEICAGFAQQSGDDWKSVQPLVNEILARTGTEVAVPMRGPEAKSVLIDDKTRMPLVWIPPGTFSMGSESGHSDEQPVHEVTLSQGYYLGQYPVTNREYALFLNSLSGAEKKERTPDYWDDRRFNQPDLPVVGVSWHDALAYCVWSGCRLPTEAEWEYACRAGSNSAYSFGEDASDLEKYGWYGMNSGRQSQPVGTKLANAWGLYDMHGNVWEWCADGSRKYTETPIVDPCGPERGGSRVLRGGSWGDLADLCRSAIRYYGRPEDRNDDFGFRVARTP